MAEAAGVSKATVQRLWSANDIKPHVTRTFKLSNDKQFEKKFWDVLGLYLDPPERALVLCCDEKSQCQALVGTAINYQQRLVQIAVRRDVSLTALTPEGTVAYLHPAADEPPSQRPTEHDCSRENSTAQVPRYREDWTPASWLSYSGPR